jgi:hypothetical protein
MTDEYAPTKSIRNALCWAALLPALLTGVARAQSPSPISRPGERTYVDSQITLGVDYPALSNPVFVSMPVMRLKKGEVLPSRGVIGKLGMDRMLSLRQFEFSAGPRAVQYPVVGLMRCSNFSETGAFVKVIASKTALRANAKAGTGTHTGGYLIEAKHDFGARQTIPTVRVVVAERYFIFSIEEEPPNAAKLQTASQPVLTIAQEEASTRDRGIALEAWRLSNASVREGILRSGTPPGSPAGP